jgi:DNA-binding PadR family transcriptional regulator
VLKDMEKGGYLDAQWDVEGSGPGKRVYMLTDKGRDCLRRWIETLEAYSKTLQQTVKFIKKSAASKTES